MAGKVATIQDVALRADVSLKTVSRFINGETNIRPALRERIAAAVRELGYQPKLAARQLAGNRSYVIALIALARAGSYNARMMIAIGSAARAVGYHLVTELIDPADIPANGDFHIQLSLRPDSAILIPPFPDNGAILDFLERQGIPTVRVAAVHEGYGTPIRVHDETITADLIRHLIALGHRRIGIVAPPLPEKASETRIAGYHRALDEAGIPVDPLLMVRGTFTFSSGVDAANRLLALPQRPTAIFATSDEMAMGVMARAQQMGYRIPQDLAVAGFDDFPESRLSYPPLTTVRQPIDAIARAAVFAATGRGGPVPELRHELLVRGSTSGDGALCLEAEEESLFWAPHAHL
ncbi:LacI family DNA-binding transcriptional regulator [Novosphingobium sp. SL115]|uniref:LacI family DNA-binding transcriptional regulator n=1 Tax=Novosphingobium sp. SL115 TaxID=2995150 RepID=UPI0022741C67|nr:LacI family DNA-binding transcriptional regulator [Novosphingobium sp. SL115]MCY1672938.1 LacI family DNA-binding transcriptional regulator [Novosphingobium sp. SL115]